MDELFTKYEHELVILRSLCREYAERYPKVAAKLQLGGEACDDPHVERLIQAVALLNARVAKRVDDAYPEFTEALLNLLFPHFLKPFPSCAIARFFGKTETNGEAGLLPAVARGTVLESEKVQGVPCTFTTVYDVAQAPVTLAAASFDTFINAPIATRLPDGVTSSITLAFEAREAGESPAAKARFYIDGDPSFSAGLRDVLFMHIAAAYLQLEEGGPWERLPSLPVMPAGFGSDEALIPFDARSHTAYRILAEYFAFPEKFNFLDIDIAALRARVPPDHRHFTLKLAIADIRPDSDKARMLASLGNQHLVQGCTPVVNLFSQPGVPITYHQRSADYTLLAHATSPQAFEVYSVDKVHLIRQGGGAAGIVEYRPFYSIRHAEDVGANKGRYWLMRHDETLALCSPGHEKSITLVNSDGDTQEVERTVVSVELTCTNRDLPCTLKMGRPEGDLFLLGGSKQNPIRFLRRPTRPARLAGGPDMQWRLISHLALNHHSLVDEGATGLREMLTLYDFAQSPVSRRQINGIIALEQCDATAWMRHKRGVSLVHGTQIRLTLDEQAFAGASLHLFVQVLDHFLGLYAHVNSFVELVAVSHQSGKELFRCSPRTGNMNLV